MEGEKKYTIPLDAQLDINSNDMFVPASQPKWSFNRQKLLGSVLQNSVRYESDGWFAGWWVHNFDLVSLGTITIDPNTLGFPSLQDKYIPGQMQKKYWIVRFNDVALQFKFAPQGWSKWVDGSGSVVRTTDQVVTITGTTTAGKSFTATTDPYTGNLLSFDTPDDPSLTASAYLQGGVYNLVVSRPYVLGNDMAYIRYGSNLMIGALTYEYTYDGTAHTWGNVLKVLGDTVELTSTDFTLEGFELKNTGLVNEYFDVHLKSKGVFTITGELNGVTIGGYDKFLNFGRKDQYDTNYVDDYNTTDLTGHDKVTEEAPFAVSFDPPIASVIEKYDASFTAGWYFPIWLKLSQLYDISFEANIYDRHILSPTAGTVNSWFECILFMKIARSGKNSSLQQVIQDLDIVWHLSINGTDYTDDQIPLDPDNPLVIKLTPNKVDSRNLQLDWPIIFTAVNASTDPEFPLPAGYIYATAMAKMTVKIPDWKNIPAPPPPWSPNAPSLWNNTFPAPAKPTDWQNPVRPPLTWPAQPADWSEVTAGITWAAFIGANAFGVVLSGAAATQWVNSGSATSYQAFCNANKPNNWPIPWSGVTWPAANAGSGWEPVWPINWPYGIIDAPYGWYSDSTSYLTYVSVHTPYKAEAANFETGGDPGFVWPGQPPETWTWPPENTNEQETYVREGNPPYPFLIPAGYTLVTSYNPNTGIVAFNQTMPPGWPDHVSMPFQSIGTIIMALLGPDVTTAPYNYRVLNRAVVLPQDRNIFKPDSETVYQDKTGLSITFPICIRGYTYYKVITVDLTLCENGRAIPDAFACEIVSNLTAGVRVFRLDDNANQPGSDKYALGTVVPKIVAIQALMEGDMTARADVYMPFMLMIGYENKNRVAFDKVKDYVWPERHVGVDITPLVDLQSQIPQAYIIAWGFYPSWVAPSEGGTRYWVGYSDFDQPVKLVHIATVLIKFFLWFRGFANGTQVAFTPNNELNNQLAIRLRSSSFTADSAPGKNVPWGPGIFEEVIWIKYDVETGNRLKITYNVATKTQVIAWSPDPADPWGPNNSATLTHESSPRDKHDLTITLERTTDIFVELRRAFIISKTGLMTPAEITAATSVLVTLSTGYGSVDRDGLYKNHPLVELVKVERETGAIKLHVTTPNRAEVQYVPEGIFESNKAIEFLSVGSGVLMFVYEGETYTLTIGNDATTRLQFNVTDIRDNRIREIASIDVSDTMMAIKQFWSGDVDVEQFWWVDDSHVLALTKYELLLYQKTDQLDDWNGDRWEIIKQGNRGNFFNNLDLYYTVSAAYYRQPVLFKLRNEGTSIRLCLISDILGMDFFAPQWQEVSIPVSTLDYSGDAGAKLSTTAITSLVPVDVNELLCSGKISSTAVGGKFMLGFAVTRGMQQWTCIFTLPSISASFVVVNGYGHVGHTGDLTGGQIPATDCDQTGFNGTVFAVDKFKDTSPENLVVGADEKIFASGSSVWFVYSEFTGIVSHLEYVSGNHVPQIIPIKGNYHCKSDISSHGAAAIFDSIPRALTILDLIALTGSDENPAQTALSYFSAVALPSVWFIQPSTVAAVLSSQGLHQAAYVNRNSLPVKSEDGKSDKDVSVARQMHEVIMSIDLTKFSSLISLLLGLVGSMLNTDSSDNLKVEASKDSNTIDDTKGRKLGQFATQAIMDGIATALTTKGLVFTVKTKATEILALSMFYTINDGTQCWAGPGFTNHQFIGQVVSQGVSAARFKLDRFGAYVPLRMITELLAKGQKLVTEAANDLVHKIFDQPGGNAGGGLFVQLPVLWLASTIAQAIVAISDFTVTLMDYMIESIPALYDMIGSTPRGFYSGGTERNVIEPEATHSYGNKPMSMFWPAFGVDADHRNSITTERVQSEVFWEPITVELGGYLICIPIMEPRDHEQNTHKKNVNFFHAEGGFDWPFDGDLYLPRTAIMASSTPDEMLPTRMACVEGIVNMLPTEGALKNLQVNCVDYTFPAPPIHDYVISQAYKIGVQAANGEIIAYSMDDTKLLDGPASNIIEANGFFGIASSYTVIEVKDTYDHNYLRPWAITPTCIALNVNGINCVQMAQAYHGFDGQFNRILSWKGGNGLDSCTMVQQYCLIVNNHFKRSNIIPPSEFFGRFSGPPSINISTKGTDRVANQTMDLTLQKGLDINIPGEDRDLTRYAVPIHSEMLSTLPAVVRMLAPYKLHVVEGITSLTTDVRNTQTKYKAPSSVDFNIYSDMWRATDEYIAQLTLQDGIVAVEDKVPSAGLTFIGATTKEAFFYSPATRMYYEFSNGGALTKRDIFNRFKDIRNGRWDFVNQEVVFKCLHGDGLFLDDVTGNFIARLDDNKVAGEMYPPNATIYNERSDFKILSMAGGLVYQGPKRCVVNRWVLTDDMYPQIKYNKRRWKKLQREEWAPGRDYGWTYDDWFTNEPIGAVHGWSHNPWRAATAMLGDSEETDSLFEWELTFAWTEQVDRIFEQNEFIAFNVAGETVTQGGTLLSRPTHIFLYKELFKHGYYTMRYTAKNGAGNRERLYMWGDGMAALESLSLYMKEITTRRMQPLATSQVDVQELQEQ